MVQSDTLVTTCTKPVVPPNATADDNDGLDPDVRKI